MNFCQCIAAEKDGFSFGKSWRYNKDSIVAILPILRKTRKRRNYLLLSEAKNVKITDTGKINKVEVENNEKKPVYIRMSEIFSGDTQERIAVRSYLIMPGEKVGIDVRCVHASKGIYTGSTMTSSGIATSNFDSYLSHTNFKMRNVEQRTIWNAVSSTSQNFTGRLYDLSTTAGEIPIIEETNFAGSDDLEGNLKTFSEKIKSILNQIPRFENQVGMALLDLEGVPGLEVFDLPESWEIMREKVIEKEGEKISKLKEHLPFEFKEERGKEFVKILLQSDFQEKVISKSKDWRLIALENENYTGERVELSDRVIHLVLTRK